MTSLRYNIVYSEQHTVSANLELCNSWKMFLILVLFDCLFLRDISSKNEKETNALWSFIYVCILYTLICMIRNSMLSPHVVYSVNISALINDSH